MFKEKKIKNKGEIKKIKFYCILSSFFGFIFKLNNIKYIILKYIHGNNFELNL